MTKEQAKEFVAGLKLTPDDEKTFETFQSLTEQMEAYQKSGKVILTVSSEVKDLKIGPSKEERSVTELHLQPVDEDTAPKTKMILAYNSRNFYNKDGVTLHKIGETNIDEAIAELAAFKVTSVERTGEWPMRKSVAAEELGFTPDKVMVNADWTRLREKYDESADNRKAAKATVYDARPIFEIPKINIESVD